MKTYAMGGFGCGNLGDEAIFEAMRLEIPDLIQIYANFPQTNWDGLRYHYPDDSNKFIYYDSLIRNGFPEEAENGELIIGGGGVFHSERAVEDFLKVALKAKERNMKISIRKVGAEYMAEDFEDLSKRLCDMAYFISVRSQRSAKILKNIGVDSLVEKDYTYNFNKTHFFKDEVNLEFNTRFPIIGFVTAGNECLSDLTNIIRLLTVGSGMGIPSSNVVHIPHCKHFVCENTNDVIAGEIFWSSIDIYHGERLDRFYNMPFSGTVWKLLNLYTKVHGIIGMRYHSYIFSELLNLPLLGITSGLKAATYFDENKRKNAIELEASFTDEELKNTLRIFGNIVKEKFKSEVNK